MNFHNFGYIEFLNKRLQNELPGISSHIKMAMKVDNHLFRKFNPSPNAKNSSVLILLIGNYSLSVLLTLRSSKLRHHNHQISFPGGRNEIGESNIDAAIRETYEETAISIDEGQIIGQLSDLYVPPSNSIITPIIASKDKLEIPKANPDEVEEIFTIDLHNLANDNNVKRTYIDIDGYKVDTPYWDVHPKVPLWGATSMILSELVDLYKEWLAIYKY